ncbi:hypothetical protein [Oscillatoria salina]|uniref:hypothetical protein n=1 Tax=Oscillatoria salina TaxID=331517 RepID=UPI0013BB1310|nr:hypothetical protein [Oscillatoria salina]MBZ8181586.1 hypothetical protein [Oscillatoria salina IIICB1]NET90384.1 hypothetical protein [Kamptonema sp. SIO1D9]
MAESIVKLVDELPTGGITVSVLRALDFIVPGEWDNLVGFENTIRAVTGKTKSKKIDKIRDRALELYQDEANGYQRAVWLYQTADNADAAMGTAAMANKVSEKIGFLGFLNKLTPKADTIQSVDLGLKIVVELVAFCKMNQLPPYSIAEFAGALPNYNHEAIMRMAALICFDGLIPLGPDFIQTAGRTISSLSPDRLEQNTVFKRIGGLIPGDGTSGKLSFINQSFDAVKGWMSSLVNSRGLSSTTILRHLEGFVEVSDDKLDYVAAFLDMSTNYYEHTGIQTVARRLIAQAAAEV